MEDVEIVLAAIHPKWFLAHDACFIDNGGFYHRAIRIDQQPLFLIDISTVSGQNEAAMR